MTYPGADRTTVLDWQTFVWIAVENEPIYEHDPLNDSPTEALETGVYGALALARGAVQMNVDCSQERPYMEWIYALDMHKAIYLDALDNMEVEDAVEMVTLETQAAFGSQTTKEQAIEHVVSTIALPDEPPVAGGFTLDWTDTDPDQVAGNAAYARVIIARRQGLI